MPVSVANYHDIKKVMDDTEHHYYIDHKDVHERQNVEPKIYINDYSESSENGLDLFKKLYDLSLVTTSSSSGTDGYTVAAGKITAATGEANTNLVGQSLLNERVKAGENLEFFLRNDLSRDDDPAVANEWTPIASGSKPCFEGTLHGDGHTISGLDNSLFGHLCGSVYNLGVTGSFTGAGIADEGKGYVESCWINTTGTPNGTVRAIFGNPTADADVKQIVNSYCQTDKSYSTTDTGNHGLARAMTAKEFYNGTVAYDLNNFYLYKRYSDKQVNGELEYKYWKSGEAEPLTGHYANNIALCSSGYNNIKYVEDRFKDGDFRYAGGTIPATEDERFYSWTENPGTNAEVVKSSFFPIWPDDYIFFGQKLTYGWAVEAHQDVPTAVVRDGGHLSYGDNANRVYRAPAYYRSKTMGVAHFNPQAYLAQTKKNVPATLAYPHMTAIDFKGYYGANEAYGAYGLGWNTQTGQFYAPLLDDDGLTGIINCDETQNLLAYAPAEAENKKTYDVLEAYFTEPIYDEHYNNTEGYRLVREAATATVHGHLVQNGLKATNDHLLVDRQDFNAPLAYDFDADHLMWYQRIPTDKEYVDLTKGWQGISIPFTAELVTTNEKGEITHFYSGSDQSHNSTTKKGHEYWLRQLTDGEDMTEKSTGVLKANFHYPAAADNNKTVGNTFLWDYYYKNESVHNQQDENEDTYLQYRQYYNSERTYANYPLLSAAVPYILGLPGQTYYEFDLSGNFEAQNTAAPVTKIGKQILSFVSNKREHIGVSDDEMTGTTVTYGGNNYTFKPSYLNETLAAGNNYVLNADGSSYDVTKAEKSVSAFRPYFISVSSGSGSRRGLANSIIFSSDNGEEFEESPETVLGGSIEIFVRGRSIVARSYLKEPTIIRIVNVAGIKLNDFVLEPGQTVVTPVKIPGVYMANKKKLFVK